MFSNIYNLPLKRFLQSFAVGIWIFLFVFAGFICLLASIYLIIYIKYGWLIIIYLIWIWIIDRHTPASGGRSISWVRSWVIWKYKRDYFPLRYEKLPGVELDPKKNYLLCCFPHGIISHGVGLTFTAEENQYFKQHIKHVVTLSVQFWLPFVRDLILSMGAISSSAESIHSILSKPEGGHICVLTVGGAKEVTYSKPGIYRISLKDRKGFVKLALRNGAPLVPVLSFGETDLYDQLEGPRIKYFQDVLRKWTRISPTIPYGRFLFFPHRRMVTIVVGKPLDVPKIMNPSLDDINKYHARFTEKLIEMFEEQKYNYLEKPEDTHFVIE